MPIVWKICEDGSFVAGDTVTGVTSYAYPTSLRVAHAKRNPEREAKEMLANERKEDHETPYGLQYDKHNWERLNG